MSCRNPGESDVSPETRSNFAIGAINRVCANLRHDRVRSLADIDRALMQRDAPIALQSHSHCRRIRQRSVAASIPHARHSNATPQGSPYCAIE